MKKSKTEKVGDKNLKITFYGGTESVTGANFLLETINNKNQKNFKILIDCGLIQGGEEKEKLNRLPFPFDPKTIDFLFITHAHLDHIGRIPKLVKDGFKGKIYSTPATKELSELSFEDAIKIMSYESDDKYRLYSIEDVHKALSMWETIDYANKKDFEEGFSIFLRDSGHILGSSIVEVWYENEKIAFTGDLGNSPSPLLKDTEFPNDADYIVMESVYGNKNHEEKETRTNEFKKVVKKVIEKKGTLLIPAFSVEKSQIILSELNDLIENKEIESIPVFLDSPFAIKATDVYKKYSNYFNQETQNKIDSGDNIFNFPKLKFTKKMGESENIKNTPNPKIIIAGAGMSMGGRILSHEIEYLSNPNTTILFTGFQVAGTVGRQILDGERRIKILGKEIDVKADVKQILSYSSHKDSDHLVEFVEKSNSDKLKKVFVVMGEMNAGLFLVQKIRDNLDINAVYPLEGQSFEI
ncbi:MAG: MBL fold metallo-hydrolase [Candidatus Paceibacterota bacterium]